MNHERVEELLAVRALGGLDGSDVAALELALAEHGDCAECRRLEDGFSETAARLAEALLPEPVSPGMLEAILSAPPQTLGLVRDSTAAVGDGPLEPLPGHRRRRNSWRTAVALAAAFALVMIVGSLSHRSQQLVHFEGAKGSLTAEYTPGEAGGVLVGSGLPKPGKGHVYEMWTITDNHPSSAGCMSPSNGNVRASITADIGSAQTLAVTIEPAGCPAAPTTAPILTATIAH